MQDPVDERELESATIQTLNDDLNVIIVTAIGRYTWDDRALDIEVLAPNGAPLPDERRKTNFSEPTYMLSLHFKPSKDSLIYAAHRQGYRADGLIAGATTVAALNLIEPEIVADIELGAKLAGRTGQKSRITSRMSGPSMSLTCLSQSLGNG
ncbi:MAG: hypothetical protein WA948_06150 [Pontixanthobacter sp.]